MRNRLMIGSCFFIVFCAGLLSASSLVFPQERGVDDLLVEVGKMGMEEREETPAAKTEIILVDKEIKYIAGEDKQWFTDDDAIYEHYQIERDATTGKMLKSSRFLPGKDKIPFTYDDILKEFQVFEYGFDGNLLKESSYDGQNAKKKYAQLSKTVYEYDAKGRKVKRICSYPGKKETRSMVYSYDEAGNQVQDVEYKGTDIEKYHRFEYDASGKLTRAMEYHVEHNGKGADGVWFTPDDVVSSTKECFYNADGAKSEDHKYISPGPDGQWFTKDDQMQYYVLFETQQ
jgi:hypothetical protein